MLVMGNTIKSILPQEAGTETKSKSVPKDLPCQEDYDDYLKCVKKYEKGLTGANNECDDVATKYKQCMSDYRAKKKAEAKAAAQ
jgi:hypothetical protein